MSGRSVRPTTIRVVIQAKAGVVHSSGFHVAAWGSFSPDGWWNNDFGDEIDFNAGVTKTLGPVEIDLGGVYYDILKVGTFDEEDIWGLTLNVSVPEAFWPVIPFLNIELDFPYEDGGLLYQAGIKHPFGWIGAGNIVFFTNLFEAEILINGHGEGFGLDAELVSSARASFSANFDFGQFKLSPEFHYQVGFGGDDGMAEDNVFWWGLSATMTF